MNWGTQLGMPGGSPHTSDYANSSYDGPVYDVGGQMYNIGSKEYGARQWTDITDIVNRAIQTAINSPAGSGTVFIPNGDYYISGAGIKLDSLAVAIVGNGSRQTRLHYQGNQACLTWRLKQPMYRTYTSGTAARPSTSSTFGAKISGFTVDGALAGTNAIGIEYGDIDGAIFEDLVINAFFGVNAIGIHCNNIYTWTEEARWSQISIVGNKIGILFNRQVRTEASITLTSGSATFTVASATQADVGKTVNVVSTSAYLGQVQSVVGTTVTVAVAVPAASAGVQSIFMGGTNSWDYHRMYGIWFGCNNGQTGIKLQNGGMLAASVLHIFGNCGYQDNNSQFLWLTGSGTDINYTTCHFAVENNFDTKAGTFLRMDAGTALDMSGTVYVGNFSVDALNGSSFKPSGNWNSPSQFNGLGTLMSNGLSVYGSPQTGNYAGLGTDGSGGMIVGNAARNDAVTFATTPTLTTVNDTKVLQVDVGKQVLVQAAGTSGLSVGQNIGTVSSVIPGVSFILSVAHGRTNGSTATLTLQGYALYLRPNGFGSNVGELSITYTGTFNLAAGINSRPSGSAAVGTITLGTAVQNNGNNALLTVTVRVAASISAFLLKVGVANSSAGATTAATTIYTNNTATATFSFSVIVPNGYWFVITESAVETTILAAVYTYM